MKRTPHHFIRRLFAAALLYVVTLLGAIQGKAATADLFPICLNADGTDSFAIIALANIPGNTRYFIADNAWSTAAGTLIQEGAPSFNQQIQFDVAAGGISFGTVIKFDQSGTIPVLKDPSQGTLTMVARFTIDNPPAATKLSISSAGDQLLIYQTAGGAVGGAVTMVSALNISITSNSVNGVTVVNGWQVGNLPQPGQTAATTDCNAPGGLTVYNGSNGSTATALGIGGFTVSGTNGVDNYKYNGPFNLADKTAYLTAINNPANWVCNDTTEYDLTGIGPGPGAPEINLQGNGANIVDGSVTPLAADHSIFGSTPVTGGNIARTFTIQNLGTSNLVISAGGITLSGANASEFSLSGITLPATIAPAGSSNFIVTFDPSAAGTRAATVNIANNDSNENPYNFNIQGYAYNYTSPTGTPPTFKWSSLVQSNNAGTTQCVGSTSSGDIIAASRIDTVGNPTNIRVTRHAGATGAVTWKREFDSGNSDDVNDMFVDPANGDAYLAARASVGANQNWFVHKANGDGTFGWTYTFDGTVAGTDECLAITRSSDGNIVVVGYTTTASGTSARAVKLNASTGASMNVYTHAVNYSQFHGVAADGSGNVYVTGVIADVNANGLTVKLNSTLGLVWSQTLDGAAALFDGFTQVAVHPSSGDCIVGGTTRSSSTNLEVIVMRYQSASPGTEVWRRVIGGTATGSESINSLVADTNGDFYLAGAIRNISSSDRDAFVSKITGSSGALAWITNRLGSGADSIDRFQNVRVSGSSVYAVGNLNNANSDIIVSRFNAGTGAEEWTLTFNGSGNGTDDLFTGKNVMTLLGTDSLALGGETFDVSGNTYGIVLKYAASLPPVVSNLGKTNNEDTVFTFAAVDFTPGSYNDPDGSPLATVRVTSLPTNGQLKISGSTFVAPQDIAIANIGTLTYTPGTNYNGSDSFGWNGSDGTAFAVSTALVNLSIREVNDAPTGTNDVLSNVLANSGTRTNAFTTFLANDSKGPANESAQTLTIINVGSAVGGTASIAGTNILFTPTSNYTGTASFVYTLQDNGTTAGANDFKTNIATVSFNILPVAPAITCPANVTTNANGFCPAAVTFNATATGVPAPTLTYKLGANAITSPHAFPVGTNTVTVTATNSAGTNTCNFTVTVAAGAPPQLTIALAGTNVVVAWTNAFPCYGLRWATQLASSNWSAHPGPFVTNGGRIFVTNSASTSSRFYQLSY